MLFILPIGFPYPVALKTWVSCLFVIDCTVPSSTLPPVLSLIPAATLNNSILLACAKYNSVIIQT